jgi:DedD protein
MNAATPMMDRRLKERLVGATILVALIVIVVPELLSGPKHRGQPPLAAGPPTSATRSVSVDLATSQTTTEPDAGAASQARPEAASPPPAAAPSSAAGGAMAAAPPSDAADLAAANAPSVATLRAQSGAQAPLETAPSPPKSSSASRAVAPAEAPATAAHRAWAVQLGSFASKANAERLAHRLQASGGAFYVSPIGSGSATRYRVRMGPLADRAAAEHALARLKSQGHSATIVTPAS